jgi:S-phase kinase-associated protein 1
MADDGKKEDPDVGGLSLDDDGADDASLKLISKDSKEFMVTRKFAFISTLVKTGLDTDPTATEVPIPGVRSDILELVIQYMNQHTGTEPPIIEKPLRSKVMKDVVKDPWDATFIDEIGENRQQLYDLILAANYMDVKSLLHLGCAKVASLIKGQPLEKIKEILSKGTKGGVQGAPAGAAADEEKKE